MVEAPWWKFYWFENDASARFEMVLAMLGAALIGWGVWLPRRASRDAHRKLRDGCSSPSACISFACYFNFGLFHFRNYIHSWDTFHYYVGSKYFKELSYDRLYECIAVADSRGAGAAAPGRAAQGHEPAHQHDGGDAARSWPTPSAARATSPRSAGQAFKKDVAFFRDQARRQALGGGCRPTTATTARRSGTSPARCWPTPAPASDDQI